MSNPTSYTVIKTTTEKLERALRDIVWDDLDLNPELVKIEYVGGRDWVAVIRTGSARQPETVLNVVTTVDAETFRKELDKRHRARRDGWLK